MDKLYYLKFPIYGVKLNPHSVRWDADKLYIKKRIDMPELLIDDRSLPCKEYIERTIHLPPWKCIFCADVDALIFNNIHWGLDKYGNIQEDLFISQNSKRDKRNHVFKKDVPIVKNFRNKIWLKGVKDPIELPVEVNASLTGIYAEIVTACGKWRVRELYHYDIRGRKVSFK